MKFLVFSGLLALAYAAPSPQSTAFNDAVLLLQQQQAALAQPVVPQVPGLAEHTAAVNQLLALQGRTPGSPTHSAAEARHAQAEAALVALQEQQAATNAANNVGSVGASGNIGPSGIVGASGNIGPSGLCGPSGCVAFGK